MVSGKWFGSEFAFYVHIYIWLYWAQEFEEIL